MGITHYTFLALRTKIGAFLSQIEAYMSPFYFEALLLALFSVVGCSNLKYVPVESKTVYNYVDSLRIKDSTVVIPVERVVDIVTQYDTLKMETSLASAVAYVDTSLRVLKGKMENKKGVEYRYLYKDRIVAKVDSIYVEKPVPVEVVKTVTPKWAWYCLGFTVLCFFILCRRLCLYLLRFLTCPEG